MIKANIVIQLTDLKNVLDVAIDELKINQGKLSATNIIDEQKIIEVWKYFFCFYVCNSDL